MRGSDMSLLEVKIQIALGTKELNGTRTYRRGVGSSIREALADLLEKSKWLNPVVHDGLLSELIPLAPAEVEDEGEPEEEEEEQESIPSPKRKKKV